MLYLGSGAEYDRRNNVPDISEEYFDSSIPKDAYGLSKYMMAKACLNSKNIYELCLFGVYGKYEEWERRFISNAICRALKGMDITLRKNIYFDYLWIDDLIELLIPFIEKKDLCYKRYNVCRGEKKDLYSLAVMVRETLEIDCKIVVKESGWEREYTANNNRMRQEIGEIHFTEWKETIRSLSEYYKQHLAEIDAEKL